MKFHAIFAAALAGMAAAGCAHAGARSDIAATFERLRQGGNVIVMGHATSPGGQAAAVGMTEGCTLAPGRGLSAQGFLRRASSANGLRRTGSRSTRPIRATFAGPGTPRALSPPQGTARSYRARK